MRFLKVIATAVLALALVGVFGTYANARTVPPKLNGEFGSGGRLTWGFSGDRSATQNLDPRNDRINGTAVQPDGKLLAVGASDCITGHCGEMALFRINPDGTFDPTFAEGGKLRIPFGERGSLEDVVVAPDGGIVVAGRAAEHIDSPDRIVIMRYDEDGRLDPTFSEDGVHVVRLRNDARWSLGALDIDLYEDGGVATSGWLDCASECHNWLVARFTPAGEADPGFLDGTVLRFLAGGNHYTPPEDRELSTAIEVDQAGRMIVAGPAGPKRIKVMRLNEDGTHDRTFGASGFTTLVASTGSRGKAERLELRPSAITEAPDGRIYVSAEGPGTRGSRALQGAIFGLRQDGDPAVGFGAKGVVKARGFGLNDIAIDRCGRVAAAGTSKGPAGSRFVLARYLRNGKPDERFGGARQIQFGKGRDAEARSFELFGRRMFVAGAAEMAGRGDEFAVASLRMARSAFRCAR